MATPVICRVCMAPTAPESSLNMFACKIPDAGCCLAELVALVGGIDVRPDDRPGGLPEWCCYRCQLDVATAYRVRILCQESDRKLREALAKEAVVVVEEPVVTELVAEQPFEPEDVKPVLMEIEGSTGCEEMDANQVLQETLKEPDAVEPGEVEGAERPDTDIVLEIYGKTWKEPTIESPGCEKVDEAQIDMNEDTEPEPNNQESKIFEEIPVADHRCCCSCRTIFNNLEELLEHSKREHAVKDPPKDNKSMKLCKICYKLKSNKHYQSHTRLILPKTLFRCKTCAALFLSTSAAVGHHLRDHYTTKACCGVNCSAVFDSVEALQLHSEQVHLPYKEPPDPQRSFVCPICFRTFQTNSHLYVHRTRQNKFKCSKCQKEFKGQRTLKRHELTHQEKGPFRCKTCSKVFHDYAQYEVHNLLHHDSTFHCVPCRKQYKQRRDLILHNIKVHGIKGSHGCDLCPASFPQPYYLLAHKRSRHGIEIDQQNQKSSTGDAEESGLECKVEVEEPRLSRLQESEEEDTDEDEY